MLPEPDAASPKPKSKPATGLVQFQFIRKIERSAHECVYAFYAAQFDSRALSDALPPTDSVWLQSPAISSAPADSTCRAAPGRHARLAASDLRARAGGRASHADNASAPRHPSAHPHRERARWQLSSN